MNIKILSLSCFLVLQNAIAQTKIPDYYIQENSFNDSLSKIIKKVNLNKLYNVGEDGMEEISFAVIDLNGKQPVLGGVNLTNFIYPASVYKIYVAMEVLNQISEDKYSLYDNYVVKSPNDVDKVKEIPNDPRPLLKHRDTVTIKYLLDLMITRSDNSAANCLIDIATRPSINKTLTEYGWSGSEVTRKFLNRDFEDPGYGTIRATETCALHVADFMYKLQTNTLINSWVSQQMKILLGGQLDTTKLAPGLPVNTMFYHKSGWWNFYTHDAGIIFDNDVHYIIVLFTPLKEVEANQKMKALSAEVYELMQNRNDKIDH